VNSWSVPGGSPTPQYMIDGLGFVHVRGEVGGGSSATVTTLPGGARPGVQMRLPTIASGQLVALLQITTAGLVQLFWATGSPTWFNLACEFLAEN
jgi:hypothetical protein